MISTTSNFIGLSGFLGGVRYGGLVKPYRGILWPGGTGRMRINGDLTIFKSSVRFPSLHADDFTALDERDEYDRDRIHFIAYTLTRWLTLLLFIAYGALGAAHVSWFNQIGPFFAFLFTLVLWSLPQSLILWSEPDIEKADS